MLDQDIERNFTYHPPKPGQPERYEKIRNKAKELAILLSDECLPSREKSLAMTNLEQSVFWANAAIARNENRAHAKPEFEPQVPDETFARFKENSRKPVCLSTILLSLEENEKLVFAWADPTALKIIVEKRPLIPDENVDLVTATKSISTREATEAIESNLPMISHQLSLMLLKVRNQIYQQTST